MGLPGLSRSDAEKVQEANVLVDRSIKVAINCILMQIPFILENPYHSMMWDVPEMRRLASLPNVDTLRVDFCQFGELYHKKTKLIHYGIDLKGLARTCKAKHGICDRTGEKHELPKGA